MGVTLSAINTGLKDSGVTQALSSSAGQAAAVSIFSKAFKFIAGEWAGDVGKACFDARKAGQASLTTFDWKGEYAKFFTKKAAMATAAPAVAEPIKKGLLGKLGSLLGKIPGMKFLSKNMVPVSALLFLGLESYNGYKVGGAPEAIKAAGKNIIGVLSFPIGVALATALFGITGFPALIAGALATYGVRLLADKLVPPLVASDNASSATKDNAKQRTSQFDNIRSSEFAKEMRSIVANSNAYKPLSSIDFSY